MRISDWSSDVCSSDLQGRVHGQIKDPRLDQAINGAERLEKMLCDEGALIFKFWFHLSKKQMKARLKGLKDDPLHSWRRPEERRVGQERVSTCRSRGSPYPQKKQHKRTYR